MFNKIIFFSNLENGFNYSLETYCALIMINGLTFNIYFVMNIYFVLKNKHC